MTIEASNIVSAASAFAARRRQVIVDRHDRPKRLATWYALVLGRIRNEMSRGQCIAEFVTFSENRLSGENLIAGKPSTQSEVNNLMSIVDELIPQIEEHNVRVVRLEYVFGSLQHEWPRATQGQKGDRIVRYRIEWTKESMPQRIPLMRAY